MWWPAWCRAAYLPAAALVRAPCLLHTTAPSLPTPLPTPCNSGVADLFLDTPLCNAHTTGCDVLWGGCPMVSTLWAWGLGGKL